MRNFSGDKGITLWMIAVGAFVFPLYYTYSGENSGTVIAQFAAVVSILQEFTQNWNPRINDFLPLWILLVPVTTYVTYLSFGSLDAILYFVSLILLVVVARVISSRRNRSKVL